MERCNPLPQVTEEGNGEEGRGEEGVGLDGTNGDEGRFEGSEDWRKGILLDSCRS